MIRFSNCKINIGLHVTGKRPDGFHDIETVFFPLPLYDVLELLPGPETTLTLHGNPIPGSLVDNIVLKAYHLLQQDFAAITPVQFHLLKNIPAGAGLGAGSANGTAALLLLNDYFSLNLDKEALSQYALHLGSDCPFFVYNEAAHATGRGERLTPIPVQLDGYKMIIVNSGIHISTPWAFQQIKPQPVTYALQEAIALPVESWQDTITNDFENAVLAAYPAIAAIKASLQAQGALYSAMSGTGSTVYGIFKKETAPTLLFPQNYYVKEVLL